MSAATSALGPRSAGLAGQGPLLLRILLALQALLLAVAIAGTHGWIVPLQGATTTDFVSFYAAGALADAGTAPLAYDFAAHAIAEQRAAGAGVPYEFFFYPPVFLLVCSVLARLPYLAAFIAFDVAGLALLLAALHRLTGIRLATLAVVTGAFPLTVWALGLGQNSLLIAAALAIGVAVVDRRPVLAGLCFATLAVKPHFGLLVPVALLAGGHWRAVIAAGCGVTGLLALSLAAFGLATWAAWLPLAAWAPSAFAAEIPCRFGALVSVLGAARVLGAEANTAEMAQMASALAAAMVVGLVWRYERAPAPRAAALAAGTLLTVPVALFYDATLLLIAIAALWHGGTTRQQRALASMFLLAGLLPFLGRGLGLPLGPVLAAGLLTLSVLRSCRPAGSARQDLPAAAA